MDIIIYTTKHHIEHKIASKDNRIGVAFWTFTNYPKHFEPWEETEKVYFAWDGFIQGYFEATETEFYEGERIPDNAVKFEAFFRELETKVATKAFQGFKYANKVPELINIKTETRK